MDLSLTKVVTNYLNVWESHSELHGIKLQQLIRIINSATLGEITTEYNALSQQHLWVDPLINVFHDELLQRVMTEATFAISTAWKTIDEWLQDPFIYIRIGFEDFYLITGSDGSIIPVGDTSINTFAITNESLSEEKIEKTLKLLIDREIVATIQMVNNSIVITSIENKDDPIERVSFYEEIPNATTIKITTPIYEIDDFNLIRRMLDGLRNKTFDIVDPYRRRLEDYENFINRT